MGSGKKWFTIAFTLHSLGLQRDADWTLISYGSSAVDKRGNYNQPKWREAWSEIEQLPWFKYGIISWVSGLLLTVWPRICKTYHQLGTMPLPLSYFVFSLVVDWDWNLRGKEEGLIWGYCPLHIISTPTTFQSDYTKSWWQDIWLQRTSFCGDLIRREWSNPPFFICSSLSTPQGSKAASHSCPLFYLM